MMGVILNHNNRPEGIRVERLDKHGFHVMGLAEMSPQFHSRAEAEKWMRGAVAKLPQHKRPRERPCLSCAAPFPSEGSHNRLCRYCRGRRDDGLGEEQRPQITRSKA